ncbi:MAG: hypothetical protein K9L28_07175 [Synergistales bacterium]|nr:hypothetical protein [Synergistales bacterium]
MKRWMLWVGGIAGLLCVALFSFLVFFPWARVTEYAFYRGAGTAAEQGIYAEVGQVEAQGLVVPEIALRALRVRTPVGEVRLQRLAVHPKPLLSLLQRRLVAEVTLGPGRLALFGGREMGWDNGIFLAGVRPGRLSFGDMRIRGELAVQGHTEILLDGPRFGESALEISAPEQFDTLFQAAAMQMPLTRTDSGEWRLERHVQ